MTFTEKEKRKNGDRRPFPWWLLVVGFILGAAAMGVAVQPRSQSTAQEYAPGMELTATHIIAGATGTAQGLMEIVPTATALANGVESDLDPFMITATHIVQQATLQVLETAIAPSP